MAWITPTLQECKDRIPKEWPALSSAAKSQGQDAVELAEKVISTQVTRIRGRVPVDVKRGEEGTIPDELESAFFALWVYEFIIKLPSMRSLLDDLRVKAWEKAFDELDRLSSGKIQVVPPVTAAPLDEQATGGYIEVASSSRPNQFSIENTSGLL
ncbi:MAG: hypothetical protein K9N47_05550 [Prosthecobacter sp.]|uniref:hypothetical protein n=1 Tax=Prosthecobacter sp. TaxID=1965333 RepID=UPI0025CE2AE9|nr:hypothetical protein [Prosthecobacter sp.]MCF7785565.1 hypothetical protein [Prosthecobacter sp.]